MSYEAANTIRYWSRNTIPKTQEFLLGDVAALLLRESPVPVVAVKMKVDSGEHEDADPAG